MSTGASSRRKGASGEREFALDLEGLIGVRLRRNLEQSRRGGHDLTLPEGADGPVAATLARLALEVKRHATVTPASLAVWWNQAKGQADRARLWPCLAYRGDRQDWRIRLPLAAMWSTFTHWDDVAYTLDLSLLAFASLLREGLILPREPSC